MHHRRKQITAYQMMDRKLPLLTPSNFLKLGNTTGLWKTGFEYPLQSENSKGTGPPQDDNII